MNIFNEIYDNYVTIDGEYNNLYSQINKIILQIKDKKSIDLKNIMILITII